jgi:DNA-binding SARP family transcriptional activator
LLTLELDHRRPAELIAQARQLAAEQPYRERRWELLMLALYRAGRQAEALDARRYAQLAIDAGEQSRTRTTVALVLSQIL